MKITNLAVYFRYYTCSSSIKNIFAGVFSGMLLVLTKTKIKICRILQLFNIFTTAIHSLP